MAQELTQGIVEAIANSKNVEPEELDLVLADYVDMDAVNQLAQYDNGTWTLTFELPEHTVTVSSDGLIIVDGQSENNWITA